MSYPRGSMELILSTSSGRSILLLADDLHQRLESLSAAQQTVVFRAIGNYLKTVTRRRLTLQQDLSGAAFTPRKARLSRLWFRKGTKVAQMKQLVTERQFFLRNRRYDGRSGYFRYGKQDGIPYAEYSHRGRQLAHQKLLIGYRDRKRPIVQVRKGIDVQVGWAGFTGTLASWHNEGRGGNSPPRRPKRQFVGINATDRQQIRQIILEQLSSFMP